MKKQYIGPTILAFVALALVPLLFFAVPFLYGTGDENSASANISGSQEDPEDSSTTSENIDPGFVQCRVDAVMAYMQAQGFEDGDFVIGEDNIDTSAPEFSETGSLGFGKDGMIVDSRDALQEVFDSSDENLQAVARAQVTKFPEIDEEVILDADNWEIVQSNVDVVVHGNTGLSNGVVVDMGLRQSQAGDAGWLFIDTELCSVPTATHTAVGEPVSSTTPDTEKPVGFVRVGCINPGDGLTPKDVSAEPNSRGNADTGGGRNDDESEGEYTTPEETEQPGGEPYVAPTTPSPTPAPTLTPEPEPEQTEDPSAPGPSNAPSACPIPPGKTSC